MEALGCMGSGPGRGHGEGPPEREAARRVGAGGGSGRAYQPGQITGWAIDGKGKAL
jgi:hypothetical protein